VKKSCWAEAEYSQDVVHRRELTNLFQNHEVVAAMGWPLMTNQLRKINFPVARRFRRKHYWWMIT